jgi:hypothetical protein
MLMTPERQRAIWAIYGNLSKSLHSVFSMRHGLFGWKGRNPGLNYNLGWKGRRPMSIDCMVGKGKNGLEKGEDLV